MFITQYFIPVLIIAAIFFLGGIRYERYRRRKQLRRVRFVKLPKCYNWKVG